MLPPTSYIKYSTDEALDNIDKYTNIYIYKHTHAIQQNTCSISKVFFSIYNIIQGIYLM